nr:thiamine-phosphate kinase [Lysobacter gilvus]
MIEAIRRRATTTRADVLLGIGDDAALLQVPTGHALVVATDTLNAGVHFPVETPPADIGWKALAVNLSDLAAMGAAPAWCTLSLSLPEADATWVDAFLEGFMRLAVLHDVALVGGDTTRGPLSISVTVHGIVDPARALRRAAAREDDDVWVSGTLGDAAAALEQWRAGALIDPTLRERLDRPTPRVALGRALGGIARACIDVSDGLLADLGHVCVASGVGAEIQIDALPASDALRAEFGGDARRHLQAAGGDDYELCFTASVAAREAIETAARNVDVMATRVGRITARGPGPVAVFDADGAPWLPGSMGWRHFAD